MELMKIDDKTLTEYESYYVPDSKGYYLVRDTGRKSGFKVYSENSQQFLKNTTRWGSNKDFGDNETFGISFYGQHGESVQNKLCMRQLKKLCGVE